MEKACGYDPASSQCTFLKQMYDGAVLRYQALMNEVPPACRFMLQDPLLF